MSVQLLFEAQQAAFAALRDICTNPTEFDTEAQSLRANVALSVVNMVPAGAFDFQVPETDTEGPLYGEVVDEDQQAEVVQFPTPEAIEQAAEEQAALAQVTVNHQPSGLDPHGAPPLGGVG